MALNSLPQVGSFPGIGLRTSVYIISVLFVCVHVILCCCTGFGSGISILVLIIWILIGLHFIAGVCLTVSNLEKIQSLCDIWVWYTLVFVCLMIILLVILAVVYAAAGSLCQVILTIMGIMFYVGSFYFIFVVNTHCREM